MPVNYNFQDPSAAVARGFQIGSAINQARQQRADRDRALAAQQAMRNDLATVLSKETPTASDYAALTVKYPQFNEQFQQAWNMLSDEQRSNRVSQASEIYASLEAGRPEIARDLLETQAQAAENTGDTQSARAARTLAETININPDAAKTSVALRLSSMMGPEEFTETFTKLQSERREASLAPEELSAAQSKARKAAVDADFAESEAALDLQKKGWDIFKIQEDAKISRENSRIAAMKAQLARETNELKRRELEQKVADAQHKRDAEVRAKVADVETANTNIDNMLNTADRILQTPIGVVEDATGPISARLPTLDQDTADFEALIENLDAQAFLAQIPNLKGMGALSDAEGKKITAALQNFNLKQSPQRLMSNVREAQRLLLKARENIARRHGVPSTTPDTPAVETSPEDIEALLQKYGG
jgi:hypothetical protein